MATSTTRLAIIKGWLKRVEGDLTGTATGGSSTTLIDTSADSPMTTADDALLFKNSWVYIDSCAHTNSPHLAMERRVTTYTPASQQCTIPSVGATAISSSDTYVLSRLLRWTDYVNCLNEFLTRHAYSWTRVPLTVVTDGDMETSGVTNWTDSSATSSKTTTAANVWNGTQALQVVTSAADGYTRTASLSVWENSTYLVQAMCRRNTAGGVPKIVVYDVTNSAAISLSTTASSDTWDGFGWLRLWSQFTTPGGCRQIQVRLQDETTTATSFWDDLILRPLTSSIALPSWIDEQWRFDGVCIPPIQSRADLDDWTAVNGAVCRFDQNSVQDRVVWIPPQAVTAPLYVAGFRNYSSLTSDSATTYCPAEWAEAGLGVEVFKLLLEADVDNKNLLQRYGRWNAELTAATRRWAPRRKFAPMRIPGAVG